MSIPSTPYSPLVRQLFFGASVLAEGQPRGSEWTLGEAGSVETGTWVRFALRLEHGRVTEARFKAYGCPHTVAAAAWFAGQVRGKALDEVLGRGVQEAVSRLDVPPEKLGRLLIVEDALRDCQRRSPGAV